MPAFGMHTELQNRKLVAKDLLKLLPNHRLMTSSYRDVSVWNSRQSQPALAGGRTDALAEMRLLEIDEAPIQRGRDRPHFHSRFANQGDLFRRQVITVLFDSARANYGCVPASTR
jgi:hypothetical protein